MLLRCSFVVALFVLMPGVHGQTTAMLTGRVVDGTSSLGLAGAVVEVVIGDTVLNATSDSLGHFLMTGTPTGISSVRASVVGYSAAQVNDVWLRSGKPEHVELLLERDGRQLPAATVRLAKVWLADRHGLSVEKSLRYPATFFDPARLASTYPGVAATNDQANHFSVRGNGPNSNTWLLEGVEIVSPNHTGNAGTPSDQPTFSGGGTVILSAQMLGNSRLLTGSMPVQYGNALGGIMDMRLRNGASDRSRFTAQAGLIGIDLSTEGPFAKGKRASYLVNYRYSTLGLLSTMGVDLGDEVITFQDLAFNISTPLGKRGALSVFGMAGVSSNNFDALTDTAEWEYDKDDRTIDYAARMGAVGMSLTLSVGPRAHWRTSAAWSEGTQERMESITNTSGNFATIDKISLRQRKLSLLSVLRGQLVGSRSAFGYTVGINAMGRTIDRIGFNFVQENFGVLLRPFAELQYAIGERLTVTGGAAYAHFSFNNAHAVEPRASLKWRDNRSNEISLSAGSRAELPQQQLYVTGTDQQPINRNIGFVECNEAALAYSRQIGPSATILRAEVFYQELSGIAVVDTRLVDDAGIGTFAMSNAWDEANYNSLLDGGTARNAGVELSLNRRVMNNWFYQVNASVFDAVYTGADSVQRDARWNNQYIANLVLGREWAKQKETLKRTWGFSGRANVAGGQRTTPIDEGASRATRGTVYDMTKAYTEQLGSVFRMDLRVYLKREHRNRTGMWALDLLNATNAQNEAFRYFDLRKDEVVTKYQLGLIPNLSYRIEF
ncbi:MAG: TonB-dependent receptor [Flavobacteriales bacterium]|nr:TonB-dependent receptor [Flavobacteriales bacterium]